MEIKKMGMAVPQIVKKNSVLNASVIMKEEMFAMIFYLQGLF